MWFPLFFSVLAPCWLVSCFLAYCTSASLCLTPYNCLQLLVDQQLAEPDDENLKKRHSSADLFDEGYFEYYEESLEWYFDPELCKSPGYDDYQRLVLYNHVGINTSISIM
jgi:hypothetical protein